MRQSRIIGGVPLKGDVHPIPNKNSILGALPLPVIASGGFSISRLPRTSDVDLFLEIYRTWGAQIVWGEERTVDLVETFNYLIGLHVKHIDHIRGIRVVEGINRDSERVLVLWRNTEETDSEKLDAWFNKQEYNTRDQEYDIVYVNGDNNLENLRRADQTWKVRMIEPEFKNLMFDVKDV